MRPVVYCASCALRLPSCVRADRKFCSSACRMWAVRHPGQVRGGPGRGSPISTATGTRGLPRTRAAALRQLVAAQARHAELEVALAKHGNEDQAERERLRHELTTAQSAAEAVRKIAAKQEGEILRLKEQLRVARDKQLAKDRAAAERKAKRQEAAESSKRVRQLRIDFDKARRDHAAAEDKLKAAQAALAQKKEQLEQAERNVKKLQQTIAAYVTAERVAKTAERTEHRQKKQEESDLVKRLRAELKTAHDALKQARADTTQAIDRAEAAEKAAQQSEEKAKRADEQRQASDASEAKAKRADERRQAKESTEQAKRIASAEKEQRHFENSAQLRKLQEDKQRKHEENAQLKQEIAAKESMLNEQAATTALLQQTVTELRQQIADLQQQVTTLQHEATVLDAALRAERAAALKVAGPSSTPAPQPPPVIPPSRTPPETEHAAQASKPVTALAPPTTARPLANSAAVQVLQLKQLQAQQREDEQRALVADAKRRGYDPFRDRLLRVMLEQVQLEDALAQQQLQQEHPALARGVPSGQDQKHRAIAAALAARAAYHRRCRRSRSLSAPIAVWVREPYELDASSEDQLWLETVAAVGKLEKKLLARR